MKLLLIPLAVMLAGCSTPHHPSSVAGNVFLGQEYRGDGVYIFPFDPSQTVSTNAFMTITNATTNLGFRVAVANGYSRPIFLETGAHNFFGGFVSTKTFYDRGGTDIGMYGGSGITYAGGRVACEYLLGRHGEFCGCTTHIFDYQEAMSYTGPERHGYTNETPTETDLEAYLIMSKEIPKNTAVIKLNVPVTVSYYILGDPHRYTKEIHLPVIVKRWDEDGQQTPSGDRLKAPPEE